ncbi:hypothetical protein Tco_0614792 [Tanacetum coccineum]
MKPENFEAKDVGGMIKKGKLDNPKQESLEPRADETLCLRKKSWLPCYGDLRTFIMHDYHTSIKAAPFEALYGCKCGSPGLLGEVSLWKGVIRFGKQGKFNPRVHSTFHVSNVKKCLSDEPLAILLDEIHIDDKLYFVKEPVDIMDHEVKRLKQSRIPIIKVRWNSMRGLEFIWEREDQFRKKYPHLFTKTAPSTSATS